MASAAETLQFRYPWDQERSTTPTRGPVYSRIDSPEQDMISGRELSASERVKTIESIIDKLTKLSNLRPNWDTYGAPAVSEYALERAAGFALHFISTRRVPIPDIVPTPSGGIQFEWHRNSVDLEIEFGASSEIEVLFEDLVSDESHELSLTKDLRSLEPLLDRIRC